MDNQTILKTLKCADSKALTEQCRDGIFDGITEQAEILGWAVHIISPTTISNCSFMRYTRHRIKSSISILNIYYYGKTYSA